MLLRFEASNHSSIMETVELSMIAVDRDRPAARRLDRHNESVLTVAGIYGPNASGKSNILEAVAWLTDAVRTSLRMWDEDVPRMPFRFGSGPERPSTFEVEMVVAGVRHTYRLEVDTSAVLFEGLYSYPERRRRVLFERAGMELTFRRGLGGMLGTRELLTPTTLALSAAMRLGEPEVETFAREIIGVNTLGPRYRQGWFEGTYQPGGAGPPSTITVFDDGEVALSSDRPAALALLRFADLGIDNVQLVDEQDAGGPITRQQRVQFLHRVAEQYLPFELYEESVGTQTWFRVIGPVLNALRKGQVLLFDEIDASLHPRLSARLLELFQDPVTNPRGAQLIFTSHDTSLLNHLNRDEVWLTEKGTDGATTLTALAEFGGDNVRRSLNLEKAYLQGRFGAVPELDQLVLRQALGLTGAEPDGT